MCPRSADVVQAGNFGAIRVLAEYGTDEQKKHYLEASAVRRRRDLRRHDRARGRLSGDRTKTTATPDGDGFRVTGEKVFTTHAPYADVMVVYVR